MTEGEYVTVESAGQLTGVPPRTIRRWVQSGKVAAMAGPRGRLIRLADVQRIADMTGRPAGQGHPQGHVTGGSAGHVADQVTDGNPRSAIEISPAASAQMAAIRDEWIQPLVDQIGQLNRELGKITAERDAAIAELEKLRQPAPEPPPSNTDEESSAQQLTPSRPWWRFWSDR